MRCYWLLKVEPDQQGYGALERDGSTCWNAPGVNAGREHVRCMTPGDLALIYHAGVQRRIEGIARVTATDDDPLSVTLEPLVRLGEPLDIDLLKGVRDTMHLWLMRNQRLQAMPVEREELEAILLLSGTELPLEARSNQPQPNCPPPAATAP